MSVNFTNSPYKNFFSQTGEYKPVDKELFAKSNNNIATVRVGDVNTDTFENENKQKKNKKNLFGIIGISAGSVLLLGIIGLSALSKGFSGGISRILKNVSAKSRKTIFDLNAKTQQLSSYQKFKLHLNKAIQYTADSMQASSNFSALKDSFLSHWINKFKLNKFADGITKYFKKITLKTKNNAYKDAEYATVDFCNYLKQLAKNQKNPQKAKEFEQMAQQIAEEYMKNFSSSKHITRSNQIWEHLEGLDKEVYDKVLGQKSGFFKNMDCFRTYITTDIIAKDRNALMKDLYKTKAGITNNLTDVNAAIKQSLYDLKISIDSSDKKSVEIVKDIAKNLDKSKLLNGKGETEAREALFKQIRQSLDELSNISKITIKDQNAVKNLEEKISLMHGLIKPEAYKKGLAQDVLTNIKLSYGGRDSIEYKTAKKYMEKMNSKLNTALGHENITYEKLAELRVGSAPMDVLGILGPSALAAALVANSKDKDERISKTLTGGIPILGGIGVSYYGTLRGWTGAKNLVLGALTGWVLNIIGKQSDLYVKKYRQEQTKLRNAFESFTKMQKLQQNAVKLQNTNNSI